MKLATSAIPIVFAVAVDPVGAGLVASLAMPGGNATGLSSDGRSGRHTSRTLREVVPGLRRLAILDNTSYRAAVHEMGEVAAAASMFGMEIVQLEIHRANEIAPAVAALKDKADALYVCTESFAAATVLESSSRSWARACQRRMANGTMLLPAASMSYGANVPALFRRAGDHVDKILRGAKPATIPVEQATKFDLVVNLITAKALGLTVPPSMLTRADEVIE